MTLRRVTKVVTLVLLVVLGLTTGAPDAQAVATANSLVTLDWALATGLPSFDSQYEYGQSSVYSYTTCPWCPGYVSDFDVYNNSDWTTGAAATATVPGATGNVQTGGSPDVQTSASVTVPFGTQGVGNAWSYGYRFGEFTATSTGDVSVQIPYEIHLDVTAGLSGEGAQAWGYVQLYLQNTTSNTQLNVDVNTFIGASGPGGADSLDLIAPILIALPFQDGDIGLFQAYWQTNAYAYSPFAVAEPGTLLLLGGGLVGLGACLRRRVDPVLLDT